MNFKLQQTYPTPPGSSSISQSASFVYAEDIKTIILYTGQLSTENQDGGQAQGEKPKKKIAFKAPVAATPSVDRISTYHIIQRKWAQVQVKGKIPAPRTQAKCIYTYPCMLVYGGKLTNGKYSNQVYALNCYTWTWKKLFNLEGPPTSEAKQHSQILFFKISSSILGLITASQLWFLSLYDVKWELSTNQLPGSVWQKIAIPMPSQVLFSWNLSQQQFLIVGKDQTIRINALRRQKVSSFKLNFSKQLQENSKHQSSKIITYFPFFHQQTKTPFLQIVTLNQIKIYKYIHRDKVEQIVPIKNKKGQGFSFSLQRLVKCCAFIGQTQDQMEKHYKYLYYIDQKGELISIQTSFTQQLQFQLSKLSSINKTQMKMSQQMKQQLQQQPDTTRIIPRSHNSQSLQRQQVDNNSSCILQEQQNQQSSVLVPSSNSRVSTTKGKPENQNQGYNQHDQLQNEQGQIPQNWNSRVQIKSGRNHHQNLAHNRMKSENQQQLSQNDINLANQDQYNQNNTEEYQHQYLTDSRTKPGYNIQNSKTTVQQNNSNQNYSNASYQKQTQAQQIKSTMPLPAQSHVYSHSVPQSQAQSIPTNRKNMYSTNNSQTNPSEKGANVQRFKHKTEQHTEKIGRGERVDRNANNKSVNAPRNTHPYQSNQNPSYQAYSPNKQSSLPYSSARQLPSTLHQQLSQILTNQSLKRKLLQQKISSLESIIKKSQKFVLLLCKYGNPKEKGKHIQKVKQIRQQLQWNWSKQAYFRKEMEGNRMPNQVQGKVRQTLSHIQY